MSCNNLFKSQKGTVGAVRPAVSITSSKYHIAKSTTQTPECDDEWLTDCVEQNKEDMVASCDKVETTTRVPPASSVNPVKLDSSTKVKCPACGSDVKIIQADAIIICNHCSSEMFVRLERALVVVTLNKPDVVTTESCVVERTPQPMPKPQPMPRMQAPSYTCDSFSQGPSNGYYDSEYFECPTNGYGPSNGSKYRTHGTLPYNRPSRGINNGYQSTNGYHNGHIYQNYPHPPYNHNPSYPPSSHLYDSVNGSDSTCSSLPAQRIPLGNNTNCDNGKHYNYRLGADNSDETFFDQVHY